ncbi:MULTISPECIES: Gx transporter family protein [unclassified Clostridium]|uniref:Gx transporter family protein n=1 Tax=unclassified Clostridium TaxID=2614128 RepID=UPI000E4FBB88|nr:MULTISPECIES: Gx transporter family protein [unclassified Clostridium]RHS87856.1 heptaprenyl diphosphate synthase [Clostridium sp. AM42-4]RHV85965.1 heptaprenyl diphosphate synthase [Clostridium sp. OF09-36]
MENSKKEGRAKGHNPAEKVALYGILIALAFIFSYVEALIPLPVPVPGMKLGLANLVNVVGIYTVGAAGTIAVGLIRIVMVGFTFSNPGSMLYALSGGVLSLAAMALAKKMDWFDKTGVSILGGVCHNIGQLSMAAWITGTASVFSYLPVLLVAGVITGAVIGLLGGLVTERIAPVVSGMKR